MRDSILSFVRMESIPFTMVSAQFCVPTRDARALQFIHGFDTRYCFGLLLLLDSLRTTYYPLPVAKCLRRSKGSKFGDIRSIKARRCSSSDVMQLLTLHLQPGSRERCVLEPLHTPPTPPFSFYSVWWSSHAEWALQSESPILMWASLQTLPQTYQEMDRPGLSKSRQADNEGWLSWDSC